MNMVFAFIYFPRGFGRFVIEYGWELTLIGALVVVIFALKKP